MILFELNQKWEIVFAEKYDICNLFVTGTINVGIKPSRKALKLKTNPNVEICKRLTQFTTKLFTNIILQLFAKNIGKRAHVKKKL